MDVAQLPAAVYTLALSIVGLGVLWLFKTPKEVNGELATALRTVTQDHELLARRFERHDEAVKNLTAAVERLTVRFDRFEPAAHPTQGRRRDSGRT